MVILFFLGLKYALISNFPISNFFCVWNICAIKKAWGFLFVGGFF